ncbi:MAG: pyruvate kinase [Nitrospirae bacterium]|nr:pyruvate kinase [Nitrospirota bacterium]
MNLPDHKTKIVCTIGPASRSEAVLEELIEQGMNVARLNFAHGTLKTHKEDIRRIRAVAVKLQRYCLIMVDLPGPKIRIGKLRDDSLLLEKGDKVILTIRDILGTPDRIPVEYKRLPESVSPGSLIFLNDGFIQLQVEKILADEVFCRTIIGGPLLSHKGLNLPGVKIFTDVVSESDLTFVDFALEEGIDTFGVSFAETADDIMKVREFAGKRGKSVYVVAKIERAEAIKNIDEILDAADAIMIARGDLGVQIPLEDVPSVQKKLIHKANLLGRPVITATQMLVSMTENIRPTRAEVSDVANAILDGTDAVMLSEETAIGRYPVEAVEMMAKIATSAEREWEAVKALSDLPAYFRKGEGYGKTTIKDIISLNAVEAARALNIHYIIVPAQSAGAPCLISRFKPDCWILSFGDNEKANNFRNLSYGVCPIFMENKTGSRLDMIMEFIDNSGIAQRGDRVIFVEGTAADDMNGVDLLRIITVR